MADSTLVAVRIPNDLLAQMDSRGDGRSAVLIGALRLFLSGPDPIPVEPDLGYGTGPARRQKTVELPEPPDFDSVYVAHAVSCTCYRCKPPKAV